MKQRFATLQDAFETIRARFTAEIVILAAALFTYLCVFDPAVYADDWPRIRDFVFHQLKWVDFNSRRPFENALFQLVLSIFGLNFRVLLVVQVLFIALSAILIYRICKRIFPGQEFLALPTALLFLVYPVDYSRLWFTRSYHWIILCIVLLAWIILLEFASKGKIGRIVAALLMFAFCLGAYDGELGLICAFSLLAAIFLRGISAQRRLALLLPCVLGGVFILWRLVLQPAVLGLHDPYITAISVSPAVLAGRLLHGYPIFIEAWVRPFHALLHGITTLKMELILAGSVAIAGLVALAMPSEGALIPWREKWQEFSAILVPAGLGLLLLAAGLIPAIVQGPPALDMNTASTRNNQFAILGSSLALAALIGSAASLLVRRRSQVTVVVYAAILPLLMVGFMQQTWMQTEAHLAWSRQQLFWRQLLVTVPNLRSGATLLVVEKSGYPSRPFQRLPLSVEWEVDSGIQVLYANPDLHGTLFFPDFWSGGSRETRLAPEGVYGYDVKFVPYDQLVIVLYTPTNDVIKLVSDPSVELDLPYTIENYHPERWILDQAPGNIPARQILH